MGKVCFLFSSNGQPILYIPRLTRPKAARWCGSKPQRPTRTHSRKKPSFSASTLVLSMETSLNFVPPLPGQRDSSTSAANSLASGKPEDLTSVQEMVFLISLERNKRSCRTLATARGFLVFPADGTVQPLRTRVSCLNQLAGDEARHKAVSLSVWRVVIHENIISVLASFWYFSCWVVRAPAKSSVCYPSLCMYFPIR